MSDVKPSTFTDCTFVNTDTYNTVTHIVLTRSSLDVLRERAKHYNRCEKFRFPKNGKCTCGLEAALAEVEGLR